MAKAYHILEIDASNYEALARLFVEFWPEETDFETEVEAVKSLIKDERQYALLVKKEEEFVGFLHVALRHEYVEGKVTPFVGYIEGIYLRNSSRGRGIGRSLIRKGEEWALANGCTQMGSDTEIENEDSIAFHKHLGYQEKGRFVAFMKDLD
ncbi:aminoglycoside 6'-N-acetyltransferase [Portibacter marinus]|uniref:aminoglycoside 6'-N-acetyltransferase n=1 Tax=Portibacter marinus TaxID=2898660 RepID=UPI001F336DFF|nr:aminoglycoside 6'-N-acetyltransferase [Portibacter marinus]